MSTLVGGASRANLQDLGLLKVPYAFGSSPSVKELKEAAAPVAPIWRPRDRRGRCLASTAVEHMRIGRNPCQIRGPGTEQASERPMIDVATILELADAIIDPVSGLRVHG